MADKKISAVIGKRPGKDTTETQSFIFSPKSAWTPDEVKAWLKKHKKQSALDAAGDSYRARQSSPSEFKKDSFRTISIKGRADGAFDADESLELDDTATLDSFLARWEGDGYDEELVEASDHDDYATVGGKRVHKSDFAHAPAGTGPSEWKLPLDTEARTRNALARYNQADLPSGAKEAVKRRILRKAKSYGIDTSGFEKKYMSETLSEVRDGKVRIMVAYTNPAGKPFEKDGRKFEITESDLQQMAQNLKQDGAKPTDYGHWSAKEDAPPTYDIKSGKLFGEDTEIKPFKNGQVALWAWWEPTPRAAALVKGREYSSFSPEIEWENKDETGAERGTRLKAGALTNRPFLPDLPEIQLSDADYNLLMGFGAEAGKLVALRLTESGGTLISSEDNNMAGKKLDDTAAVMKRLGLKRMEGEGGLPGKFRVHGDDGTPLGDLEADDVFEALDDAGVLDHLKRKLEAEGEGEFAKKLGDLMIKHHGPPSDTGDGSEPDDDDIAPQKLADKVGARGLKLREIRRLLEIGKKAAPGIAATESRALLLKEAVTDKGTLVRGEAFDARIAELSQQGRVTFSDYMAFNGARRMVEQAIREIKILPRHAAFYLREAVERPKDFAKFAADAQPIVPREPLGADIPPDYDGRPLLSAQEEADKMARQLMAADKGLKYDKAMLRVLREDKGLAKRLDEERNTVTTAQKRGIQIVQ